MCHEFILYFIFEDPMPMEWYKVYEFTPSALRDLDLKLNLQNGPTASPSLTISWSINIDSEYIWEWEWE